MREQLQGRLQELEKEFETGQKMLADLEAQQAQLRDTLLRIDGARHVLRELLAAADQAPEQRNGELERAS